MIEASDEIIHVENETEEVVFGAYVYTQVHKFVNISAVMVILVLAAIQRAADLGALDLAGIFVDDQHLKAVVHTVSYQGGLLALTSFAVILSLWQLELLSSVGSNHCMQVAIESAVLLLLCWLGSGGLILSQAQRRIKQWRRFEEANSCD